MFFKHVLNFCSLFCVFVLLFGYVFVLWVLFGVLFSFGSFVRVKSYHEKKNSIKLSLCLWYLLVPSILFVLFVCEKSYHKINKKFKTVLIISFILLLSPIRKSVPQDQTLHWACENTLQSQIFLTFDPWEHASPQKFLDPIKKKIWSYCRWEKYYKKGCLYKETRRYFKK